jgi:hypothetical protein
MRGSIRTLCLLGVAGCGYGDGEGLDIGYVRFESPAKCEPERCAVATTSEVGLAIDHWASDWVEGAYLDVARTDRPDLISVDLQHVVTDEVVGDIVVVRGLAPGRAVLHMEQQGYESRLVLEQTIDVVDPSLVYVTSRYGSDAVPLDGRMQLLAASKHTLVLERRDAANKVLLAETGGPWSISGGAAATLSPEGATGALQTIVAGAPESVVVTSGDVSLPIDIVPASSVASMRVHVRERPNLVADDGGAIHLPEAASFFFVVEAYDATGHYLAGAGARDDYSVIGGTPYDGATRGRGFTTSPVDHTVTIALGGASMTVKLVYP